MDELLSIAELADIAGVKPQAIYKRIKNGTIKEYVVLKDGHYFLKASIIELYQKKEINPEQSTVEQPTQKQDITALLLAQIESKDKMIAEQQATIKAQQEHIVEQSKKLAEIIEKQNELQTNYQILIAKQFDIKALSTVEQPVEQPVEKVEQPVENTNTEPEPQQKQGFFRRIFRKNLK